MPEIPIEDVVFSRHLLTPAARAALYRKVRGGDLQPLTRGAFVPAARWQASNDEERHRAVLAAIAVLNPGLVFAELSAALAWHRPLLGSAPAIPRTVAAGTQGRQRSTFRSRNLGSSELVDLEAFTVTPLARTVVDTARTSPFVTALAVADHALSRPLAEEAWPRSARSSRDELEAAMPPPGAAGRARAGLVLGAANGLSGSPGETKSRALIASLGFPAPVLQQRFDDQRGLTGFVDFFWPEFGLAGEFDGVAKYVREDYAGGLSPAEVVLKEKRREDRLRALGLRVARWEWWHLIDASRLSSVLISAGLPRSHRARLQWYREN